MGKLWFGGHKRPIQFLNLVYWTWRNVVNSIIKESNEIAGLRLFIQPIVTTTGVLVPVISTSSTCKGASVPSAGGSCHISQAAWLVSEMKLVGEVNAWHTGLMTILHRCRTPGQNVPGTPIKTVWGQINSLKLNLDCFWCFGRVLSS